MRPKELERALLWVSEDWCRQARMLVLSLLDQRKGGEFVDLVRHREATEDVRIGADVLCEALFVGLVRRAGLRIRVFSEHHPDGYDTEDLPKDLVVALKGMKRPDLLVPSGRKEIQCNSFLDPLDGSNQVALGIPEALYIGSVTFRGFSGRIIAGAVCDALSGYLYLASREWGVWRKNVRDESVWMPEELPPLTKQTRLVIAAYGGKEKYVRPIMERLAPVFQQEDFRAATRVWNGGSFIYALLALGIVHAYAMFGEPPEEIATGMAHARFARPEVKLYSAENGKLRHLPRDPKEVWDLNPIPFFIATPYPEIARRMARFALP